MPAAARATAAAIFPPARVHRRDQDRQHGVGVPRRALDGLAVLVRRGVPCRACGDSVQDSPTDAAADTASRARAAESLTTASRRPAGSGCEASRRATSNSSVTVSTRTTPACRSSAASTSVAAVVINATTGLRRLMRRASRANLRGLPTVSR